MRKPKVVYIGQKNIGESIAMIRSQWDFVGYYEKLFDFWNDAVNETKFADVDLFIILDVLAKETEVDQDGNVFSDLYEQSVKALASYGMLAILQYDKDLQSEIVSRVQSCIDAPIKYFFVDKNGFNKSMDSAVKKYAEKAVDARELEIASRLLGFEIADTSGYSIEEASGGFKVEEEGGHADTGSSSTGSGKHFGDVIVVTSSKGGSGKTTVALTLATFLSHASQNAYEQGLEDRPLKVCVVDTDIKDSQVGFLVGAITPNLADLLHKGVINKETIDACKFESSRLKIDVLLGPRRVETARQMSLEFFDNLITELRKHYDFIIIDTSVDYTDSLYSKVVYPSATAILFVTDIVIQSVYGMTRWIGDVTRSKEQYGMGIPKSKIGVIVNKSIDNVAMSPEQIRKAVNGVNIVTVVPNSAKLFAHASNTNSVDAVLRHKEIVTSFKRVVLPLVKHRGYNIGETVVK